MHVADEDVLEPVGAHACFFQFGYKLAEGRTKACVYEYRFSLRLQEDAADARWHAFLQSKCFP